jgi:hypothetical protein
MKCIKEYIPFSPMLREVTPIHMDAERVNVVRGCDVTAYVKGIIPATFNKPIKVARVHRKGRNFIPPFFCRLSLISDANCK